MAREEPVIAVVVAPGNGLPEGLGVLAARARLEVVSDAEGFARVLPPADVLAVYDFRTRLLHEADWSQAGDVTWVHAASAGVDAVLAPAVVERGITVTNSRGVFDTAIAEYVLGLMLMVTKDVLRTLRLQRERRWLHRDTQLLRGKHLLVVGAGSIGQAIGRLAGAAGMTVDGIARTPRSEPGFGRIDAASQLLERLPGADFVVIATPLTEETRGMFGAGAFAAMRDDAWLINIGRGAIVDEGALLEALEGGRLAGAALDVFAEEPLPADHPFWGMDNVIVSPHMAGDFEGWVEALSAMFVENFDRWQRGEPLVNVVETGGLAPVQTRGAV